MGFGWWLSKKMIFWISNRFFDGFWWAISQVTPDIYKLYLVLTMALVCCGFLMCRIMKACISWGLSHCSWAHDAEFIKSLQWCAMNISKAGKSSWNNVGTYCYLLRECFWGGKPYHVGMVGIPPICSDLGLVWAGSWWGLPHLLVYVFPFFLVVPQLCHGNVSASGKNFVSQNPSRTICNLASWSHEAEILVSSLFGKAFYDNSGNNPSARAMCLLCFLISSNRF